MGDMIDEDARGQRTSVREDEALMRRDVAGGQEYETKVMIPNLHRKKGGKRERRA
jgi:hypothetical protein